MRTRDGLPDAEHSSARRGRAHRTPILAKALIAAVVAAPMLFAAEDAFAQFGIGNFGASNYGGHQRFGSHNRAPMRTYQGPGRHGSGSMNPGGHRGPGTYGTNNRGPGSYGTHTRWPGNYGHHPRGDRYGTYTRWPRYPGRYYPPVVTDPPRVVVTDENDDPPPRPTKPPPRVVHDDDDAPPPRKPGKPVRAGAGGSGNNNASRPPAPPPAARPAAVANVPAGERRFVPDQVICELRPGMTEPQIDAFLREHRMRRTPNGSKDMGLLGTRVFRYAINDRRPVPTVVASLASDSRVVSAQPNYLFALQDDKKPDVATPKSGPDQYALEKLKITEAHRITKGDRVLVAVIDSGIDATHPDIAGSIAKQINVLDSKDEKPHSHGTAMAGAIIARATLTGVAPASRIIAIRAFSGTGASAQSTTFDLTNAVDQAVAEGARVINLSFAGPQDPMVGRSLKKAFDKGIVLIAAAGNAGPKSPPLFPGADANVIAVTATDSRDELFKDANRGAYLAVAAPGVQVIAPAPGAGYQMSTGTSIAAAHVSGVAALLIERNPKLDPTALRKVLMSTAKDLGPKGRDDQFGAGIVDAYEAVSSQQPVASAPPGPSAARAATQ